MCFILQKFSKSIKNFKLFVSKNEQNIECKRNKALLGNKLEIEKQHNKVSKIIF